jgi:thiol-disulfide isomerase/thioredoxin
MAAGVCLLSTLATPCFAQPADTLAQRELPNRPDHWPDKVTLKVDADFGSLALKKGESYKLIDFNGSDVVLEAKPNMNVAVSPDECDLLEAANAMWAKLTPEQRAVDILTLPKDASLWPDKVTAKLTFDLTTGKSIPAGTEFDLVSFDGQGVNIYTDKPEPARLHARLADTDIFPRARERVLIDPAKRPSRMVEALKANLVDNKGQAVTPAGLEETKVFVFYFGASWCQPCRQFSPGFVKFVNEQQAANPHMTVVMLNCDDDEAKMLDYMQAEKMPFPAIKKATLETLVLHGFGCGTIPQMVVTDRYGKVLANTFENSQYVGPKRTLAQLQKILASGAAK